MYALFNVLLGNSVRRVRKRRGLVVKADMHFKPTGRKDITWEVYP